MHLQKHILTKNARTLQPDEHVSLFQVNDSLARVLDLNYQLVCIWCVCVYDEPKYVIITWTVKQTVKSQG